MRCVKLQEFCLNFCYHDPSVALTGLPLSNKRKRHISPTCKLDVTDDIHSMGYCHWDHIVDAWVWSWIWEKRLNWYLVDVSGYTLVLLTFYTVLLVQQPTQINTAFFRRGPYLVLVCIGMCEHLGLNHHTSSCAVQVIPSIVPIVWTFPEQTFLFSRAHYCYLQGENMLMLSYGSYVNRSR